MIKIEEEFECYFKIIERLEGKYYDGLIEMEVKFLEWIKWIKKY